MAAFAALIEFHAVDIDTFASQLAGEVDWVSGDPSFQGLAAALFANAGGGFGTVALDQRKPVSHLGILAELGDPCTCQ
jgi:hypothetical protein